MKNIGRIQVLALAAVFAATLGVTAIENKSIGIHTIAKYPATVCPSNLGDGTNTAVLPNSKVQVRSIPNKTNSLVPAASNLIQLGNRALFVDGNQSTSIAVTRGSSGWLATTPCLVSDSDQWLVGGSGSITSKAALDIVNSGLSNSIVDLFIFTTKGALPIVSQNIPSNSEKSILIDTLAPGEDSVVIHAVTRSGRVSIFLIDQRKKGLRSLGAEYVHDGGQPSTHLVIPAIPNIGKSKNSGTQIFRALAPGNVDATIKVKIVASDGAFAPIELDGKVLKHGNVLDLPFSPVLSGSAYALVVDSDVPVIASVQTKIGNDFSWATNAGPFPTVSLNFGGLTPRAIFQGDLVTVGISWIDINGKSGTTTVSGQDFVSWVPKTALRRATFTNFSHCIGGILFQGNGQISNLPIVPGAILESASVPEADSRILSRG